MSTTIQNVHIFEGTKLSEITSVTIANEKISLKAMGDEVIDGNGGVLLPGLIDSHVHIDSITNLEEAAKWGITTMLDMNPNTQDSIDNLRDLLKLPNILTSYNCAIYPIADPEKYVLDRIAEGAEYIKIVIEDPPHMAPKALDPATVSAIVAAAHNHNYKVIAHAATIQTYRIAIDSGVDIITHIPITAPVPSEMIAEIAKKGIVVCPTMIAMKEIIINFKKRMPEAGDLNFEYVEQTVSNMIKAGVTIVAGTDSNLAPFAPANPPHGKSLHEELEMYISAGMSPSEAINSATSIPAKVFSLCGKGLINEGYKADLILIDGDPTSDIKMTNKIKCIWINGNMVK